MSKISKLCLKVVFTIPNNADLDEMSHSAAFYPGLHCLPYSHLQIFQYKN